VNSFRNLRHALSLECPGPTSARKVKQMKKTVAWSIFLVLGQLNSTSRAQSQDDIANQFAGMWRLVSNPQRLADGTTRQGSNRVAYVMFDTDAGHMCFVSMDPNRPRWKSETAPTSEERLSAIGGFGAYCATVEIHAKEGFIVRHYEINQDPNAVGKATKRWYTFQGTNRMSLRIDTPELNSPVVESTLIWERVVK
jgi:Lipocalin-like domain